MEDSTVEEKGSFIKGLLISLPIIIFCLFLLAILLKLSPYLLGRFSVDSILAVLCMGLISRSKKFKWYYLVLMSFGISILAFIISFIYIK